MKKKIGIIIVSVFMLLGCAGSAGGSTGNGKKNETEEAVTTGTVRPSLLSASQYVKSEIVPALEEYTVASDFSNTINMSLVAYLGDDLREQLLQNYFVVTDGYSGYEFHEMYEWNKYDYVPSFITTDSVLHAFHLYYAHLQKEIEKTTLKEALTEMSRALLEETENQVSLLKGSEWESAAVRNRDYCSVALKLLGEDVSLSAAAQEEVDRIFKAEGVGESVLFSAGEKVYSQDYTQFIPRGYYTQSEELEEYFRAMMWYGQMNFSQDVEDLDRSALLMNLALRDKAEELWEKVYLTTVFFAGESDDNGYYEYAPLIGRVYGEAVSVSNLPGNEKAFAEYRKQTEQLDPPKINSMVVFDKTIEPDRDQVTKGFRVLGQRFTIDGYIMQRLVYRDVDENNGKRRMLPDALDVPAALGSEEASVLLSKYTDVDDWPDYEKNMTELRKQIEKGGESLWKTSISASWLGTLTSLTEKHGEGWPKYMQNDAWTDKDLNTFLGSYTELKHDTVLYAKQVMAEMGAAGFEKVPPDDRGYVEPAPDLYRRLSDAAKRAKDGLQEMGLLSGENAELADHIMMIADKLAVISEKELKGELPSDEEFEFIRSYGGQLEHLWIKTIDDDSGKQYYDTMDHPASLVTDIATDPNGVCLQLGTGSPDTIYVLVYFDGEIRICRGAVYSFYQFTNPISQRMTDTEWNDMVRFNKDSLPERPQWTSSFFRKYTTAQNVGADRLGYIGTAGILVDDLNSRSTPSTSGEKLEPVKIYSEYNVYEVTENEGYTWYRIGENRWIADQNGKWVYYSPVQ